MTVRTLTKAHATAQEFASLRGFKAEVGELIRAPRERLKNHEVHMGQGKMKQPLGIFSRAFYAELRRFESCGDS
jgi:hypothetical protein